MDYLDRLIRLYQIEGEMKVICRFSGDWHIDHPQEKQTLGVFHIISKGNCCIKLDGNCHKLKAGDVIFLPYGAEHELFGCPTLQHFSDEQNPIQSKNVGGLKICRNSANGLYDFEMFCGYIHYRKASHNHLLQLPKWHLSSNNQSIIALLALLRNESETQLGSQSVINALANVLFTYLMRDYLEQSEIQHSILAAFQDKRLQNAINAILNTPEADWTMDNLAERCLMSRSNFIRTFKEKTGLSAGKFLTEIRLQKAEQLLQYSQLSIQQIAFAVGYQSEAHFSKLFKAYKGNSPSELRSR